MKVVEVNDDQDEDQGQKAQKDEGADGNAENQGQRYLGRTARKGRPCCGVVLGVVVDDDDFTGFLEDFSGK